MPDVTHTAAVTHTVAVTHTAPQEAVGHVVTTMRTHPTVSNLKAVSALP